MTTAVRWLGVLIAATCALAVSNNWCLVVIPAAIAALVADSIVRATCPRLLLRIVAAGAAGVAVGLLLRVGPTWAFQEAFELDPPPGVRAVRIRRHLVAPPPASTS